MAETQPAPETKPADPGAAPAPKVETPAAKVFDETYVKGLREEAKGYREKLEAIEKAKADAEAKVLAEQGKWSELADRERKRADELAKKAEQADAMAKQLDELKTLELAKLPDDIRADLSDLPPTKAIALARKWQTTPAAKAAPAVPGGSPAASSAPINLSGLSESAVRAQIRSNPDALAKAKALVFGAQRDPFTGS